jgi:hypothetical protein
MPTIGNGTNWVSISQNTINEGLQKIGNNVSEDISPQDVRDAVYTVYYLLDNEITNKQLNFQPNATGIFTQRSLYDNESEGFSFLATDNGNLYYLGATAGVWGDPIPFGSGQVDKDIILTTNFSIFKYSANGSPEGTQTATIKPILLGGIEFEDISWSVDVGSFSVDSILEEVTISETQFDSASADSMTLTADNGSGVTRTMTLIKVQDGGGASNFLELPDTPSNYTSAANKFVKINPGATGINFVEYNPGFSDLYDTPNLSGTNNYLKIVSGSLTQSSNITLNTDAYIDSGSGSFIPNDSSGDAVVKHTSGNVILETAAGDVIKVDSNGDISFPQFSLTGDKMLTIQSNNKLSTNTIPTTADLTFYQNSSNIDNGTDLRIMTISRNGTNNFNVNGVIEITGRRAINQNSAGNHAYAKIFYSLNINDDAKIVLLEGYNITNNDIYGDRINYTDMAIYLKNKYDNFTYKVTEILGNTDPNMTKTFQMDTVAPSLGTTFSSVVTSGTYIKGENNYIKIVDSNDDSILTYNETNETLKINGVTSSLNNYNTTLEVNSDGIISRPEDNFRISTKKILTPNNLKSSLSTSEITLIENPHSDRIIRVESVDIYYQHVSATYSGGETFSIQYSDGTSIYDIDPSVTYNTAYRKNLNLGEKEYTTSNFGENIVLGTVSNVFTSGDGYLHLSIVFSSIFYNVNLSEVQFNVLGSGYSGDLLFSQDAFAVGTLVENQTNIGSTVSGTYLVQNDNFVYNITDNLIVSTSSFLTTNATYSSGGNINSGTATGVTLSHISALNNGIIVSDLTTNTFYDQTFIDTTKFYITDNSSSIIGNSTFYGVTSSVGTFSSIYIQGTTSVSIGNIIRDSSTTEFITDDYYYYSNEILEIATGSIVERYSTLGTVIDDLTSQTTAFTFSTLTGTVWNGQGNTSSFIKEDSGITTLSSDIILDSTNGSVNYIDSSLNEQNIGYKVAWAYDEDRSTFIGQNSDEFNSTVASFLTTTDPSNTTYITDASTGSISSIYISMYDTIEYNDLGLEEEIGNKLRGGIYVYNNSTSEQIRLDYVDYINFFDSTEIEITYGTYSSEIEQLPIYSWNLPIFGIDRGGDPLQALIHGSTESSVFTVGTTIFTFTEHVESPLRNNDSSTQGNNNTRPRKWKEAVPILDWIRDNAVLYNTDGILIDDGFETIGTSNWVLSINNIRYIIASEGSTVEAIDTYPYSQGFIGINDPGRFFDGSEYNYIQG